MTKKKYISILIFIILVVSLIVFKKNNYINEAYHAKRIFKSERAFGDDYFDIYVINSPQNKQVNGKKIDNNYYKESKRFKQIMLSYKSEIGNYDVLTNSLYNLEKDKSTIYLLEEDVDKKGHRTLYIFNDALDIGYIFDFQI